MGSCSSNGKGSKGGGSLHSVTPEQQKKINNIKKRLAERDTVPNPPKFELMSDGWVSWEYTEVRNYVQEHAGKMYDPNKSKLVERITTKSGVIGKDGLIKYNPDVIESEKIIKKNKRK